MNNKILKCSRCLVSEISAVSKSGSIKKARKLGWRFFAKKPVCPSCLTDQEKYSGFRPGNFSKTSFIRLLNKQPELYPSLLSDCPGERYGHWLYEFHKEYFNESYLDYCKHRL
jgi:hypothetical protein